MTTKNKYKVEVETEETLTRKYSVEVEADSEREAKSLARNHFFEEYQEFAELEDEEPYNYHVNGTEITEILWDAKKEAAKQAKIDNLNAIINRIKNNEEINTEEYLRALQ